MASGGEQTGTEIPTDIARLPVGEALRTRREQLGWSLPEVAAWLRIRLPYLEALEGGQVGRLPGNAYAMGFLRAYAAALGLDADDMVRRFRGETKDVTRKPELSFPVPVPERGVPAGAIVLLGVVMVVAAYVGWYELSGRSTHEAHTVPPVPEALAPYAGVAGRGPSPQVATVMPGPGQTPSPTLPTGTEAKSADQAEPKPAGPSPETAGVVADMPALTAGAGTAAATHAEGAAPGVPPVAVSSAQAPAQALGQPAAPMIPPATGPVPAAPDASNGQVTLNALSNSWVQVRQVGGKVIYDHVLQAGEHWSVPADAGAVVLNTGNAGGLTVSADGVTSPVLGRVGAVRRGIPLTAEAVKSGAIASAAGGTTAPAQAAPASAAPTIPAPGPAAAPAGGAATDSVSGAGAITAKPATHSRAAARPTPAPETGEDETERLNRAQLKHPETPQ